MKKIRMFLVMIFVAFLMVMHQSSNAFALDTDNDEYDDGDVAVIQQIIRQSETLQQNYDINSPSEWDFIVWQPSNEGVYKVQNVELSFQDAQGKSQQINDFVGEMNVEELDQLVTLWCYDNPGLTAIQLPNSSKFNYLHCSNTSVTSLDLSPYPELQVLYVSNTKLEALDVSNNTKLSDLFIDGTAISDIDLSSNLALEMFLCTDTPLTALDVSKNVALQELRIDNTAINSIDLSNNTALETFTCIDTPLTDLDVSKNVALKELQIDNTAINSIDLSNNTALETFTFLDTPITTLDISQLTHLKNIYTPLSFKELKTSNGYTITLEDCQGGIIRVAGVDMVNNIVSLEAVGGMGNIFMGWTHDTSKNNRIDVLLTSNLSIGAYFATNEVALSELKVVNVPLENNKATVSNEVTEIEIVATPTDPYATVTGTGKKALNEGENKFTITVLAADGITTFKYEITITRLAKVEENLSPDNSQNTAGGENSGEATPQPPTDVLQDATGDEVNLVPFMALILLSGCSMGVLMTKKKYFIS